MLRAVAYGTAVACSAKSMETAVGDTMQLQFASLEDRILWHLVREVNHAGGNIGVPTLVQTLSDLGPAAVARVIEQIQDIDD